MPKWLSSTLIVIGFIALIALAVLPREITVTVTTNVDDRDESFIVNAGESAHAPPQAEEDGG